MSFFTLNYLTSCAFCHLFLLSTIDSHQGQADQFGVYRPHRGQAAAAAEERTGHLTQVVSVLPGSGNVLLPGRSAFLKVCAKKLLFPRKFFLRLRESYAIIPVDS